jgi:short-subunit dehydrogenase
VQTEFQEVASRSSRRPETVPSFVLVPAKQVVRDALTALEADRPLVIPGLAIKIIMCLSRLIPMPILRLVLRLAAKRD